MRAAVARLPSSTLSDAQLHCLAAGLIALHCSAAEARLASYGKEIVDIFGPGNAEWRDLNADRQGIACARSATTDAGLFECCEQIGTVP
jgi:hypothetical protein